MAPASRMWVLLTVAMDLMASDRPLRAAKCLAAFVRTKVMM